MHLPINDFDLAVVTNVVTEIKARGLTVDYDVSRTTEGIIVIFAENFIHNDGTFVIYEIHKVAKKRFLVKEFHG